MEDRNEGLPNYKDVHNILKAQQEDRWLQYRRMSVIELRLCERADDTGKIGVDYIARDPANHELEWPMTADEVRRNFRRI